MVTELATKVLDKTKCSVQWAGSLRASFVRTGSSTPKPSHQSSLGANSVWSIFQFGNLFTEGLEMMLAPAMQDQNVIAIDPTACAGVKELTSQGNGRFKSMCHMNSSRLNPKFASFSSACCRSESSKHLKRPDPGCL